MGYKLSLLKNALCTNHVLLDNDSAGKEAFEKAEKEGMLKQKDATFIICNGMTDSEFEDCLNKVVYAENILNDYGVDINVTQFRGNSKWSNRMRNVFLSQGKNWNENVEAKVKHTVAESIKENPENALCSHKRGSIDALVKTLERMIEKIK